MRPAQFRALDAPEPPSANAAALNPEAAWVSAQALAGCGHPSSWGMIQCWEGEHLLFGTLRLDEDLQVTARPGESPLQRATATAFREVFACLNAKDYPHLVRVWNYLPRINALEDGLERYRRFNIGRQDAFIGSGRSLNEGLPAASALGSDGHWLEIGFLATRLPVQSLENPRQMSAFCYPEDYGPRSPTFARAILLHRPDAPRLFISGTASIVGHHSLHPGDASAQTRETIANLAAVISEANRAIGTARLRHEAMDYVVYVRNDADVPAVIAALQDWLPGHRRWHLMRADICRRELLVEIEGMSTTTLAAPAP